MGGSGRGGFLLVPQQRKGSLFLKALPFLETTCGILDASGGSVRSGGHVAHVSHSYLLAYCIPLHNFRYGIHFSITSNSASCSNVTNLPEEL